jgi:hypothetical protein
MNNELIRPKSWWKKSWKWLLPIIGLVLILVFFVTSTGLGGVANDFAQAYSETELYENAIKKVNSEPIANELLGDIESLGKLAILEGETQYSNDNQTVNSTVRIIGIKEKARMDITAERVNGVWNYSKINVRIKNPPNKKQMIEINTVE